MPLDPSLLSTQELEFSLSRLKVSPSQSTYTNWSRTYSCSPASIFVPDTEYQCELILELAKRLALPVRATGVGHSPSDIACTRGFLVRTLRLDRLIEVNVDSRYVVIQGGMTLERLHQHLDEHNLAMSNMGSISDQTIAGVTTVATHGTGINYKVIPTYVLSMVILLADGRRVTCSRKKYRDLFLATLCGFGATGLVLRVQLQVEPAFRLQETQEVMPFPNALKNLDALTNAAEHVRMWWFPSADKVVVGGFDRIYQPPDSPHPSWLMGIFGLHAVQIVLLIGNYIRWFTPFAGQLALFLWFSSKPTSKIDISYRVFNLDCKYRQYTTEWAIPYDCAGRCLRELHDWLSLEGGDPNGLRPHFPIEIRFSDGDDIFLSPSQGRKSCWIGIIQHRPYGQPVPYREIFSIFESIMQKYSGRPHWSKSHSLTPAEITYLYPKFEDFLGVLETYDPAGVFRNEYVRRHIYGENIGEGVFEKA